MEQATCPPTPGEKKEEHVAGCDDETVSVDEERREASEGLPWRRKGPVLVLILLLTLGSNWAAGIMNPMKTTLEKELRIDNTQYGVIAGAHSLTNTVFPVISGLLIDRYGPNVGSFASSTAIFVGALLTALGTSFYSYPLVVLGQVIFGLGNLTIETAQSKTYAKYCKGSISSGPGTLAFINGLDIGLGRAFTTIGTVTAVPIYKRTGKYEWTFWVVAIVCGLTVVINACFIVVERRLPQHRRSLPSPQPNDPRGGGRLAALRVGRLLKLSAFFWLLAMSQSLQAGTVQAYQNNLSDMVMVTRGRTLREAGYNSAIGEVLPIVLTPLLGIFFDRCGRRMHLVSITAGLWILCVALLGFSQVDPLLPTILGSVALSFNVLPFLVSIPLLVPGYENVGTAYGIWKAFNSAGTTIMDVAVGRIQDQGARTKPRARQFDNVFYLLIALKAVDVGYGLVYHHLDKVYLHSILFNSEKRRLAFERDTSNKERETTLGSPVRRVSFLGIGVGAGLIITTFTVYIYYARR